jgi:NAD(P)H-dependent FMN reductase
MLRYIPAETKVALCISADAGNGASIESGNHLKKIMADFKKDAITKQRQTVLQLSIDKLKLVIF